MTHISIGWLAGHENEISYSTCGFAIGLLWHPVSSFPYRGFTRSSHGTYITIGY
jgi:hypothetical protein